MATLTSITVSPANPFVLINNTQQFTATANFSDSTTLVVTTNSLTAWDMGTTGVTTDSVANVNNTSSKGLVTANTISGYAVVRATYQGITGQAIIRVGLANYTRIIENVVNPTMKNTLPNYDAHAPIVKSSIANTSLMSGGVVLQNQIGTVNSIATGWTIVSNHPEYPTLVYIANEQQRIGDWVGLTSDGYSTTANANKNIGVVTSICVDANNSTLVNGGYPVLVQYAGDAYVYTEDTTITTGCWLNPSGGSVPGGVINAGYSAGTTNPSIGFALENYAATYTNMVKMRIQICGE